MRVLILSADVGESHTAMARALAAELESRQEVSEVTVLNDFSVLGRRLGVLLRKGFKTHLGEARWTYDFAYRAFTRRRLARRTGEAALFTLGGRALSAALAHHRPDVVVSTYPVMNPVLGRLRGSGRIDCPVAAVVGPLGGLAFWAQRHIDLHLLNYAEALPELRRLVGDVPAVAVRPLVRGEFFEPVDQGWARETLRLPPHRRVMLVSGGGWGAGDLVGAIERCREPAHSHVVAVAGRNDGRRVVLEQRFDGAEDVTILGFTDRMRDLLCAADVFVTATAGVSCIEARLCRCPVVCYGFPVAHVRENSHAMAAHSLARVAGTPQQLSGEIAGALSEGRPAPPCIATLPSAAELTLSLARVTDGDRAAQRRSPAGRARVRSGVG